MRQCAVRHLITRMEPHRVLLDLLRHHPQGLNDLALHNASSLKRAVFFQELRFVVEPEVRHLHHHRRTRIAGFDRVERDEHRSIRIDRHAIEPPHQSAARHHMPVEIDKTDDLERHLESPSAIEL